MMYRVKDLSPLTPPPAALPAAAEPGFAAQALAR
jgi:hypothetical protein